MTKVTVTLRIPVTYFLKKENRTHIDAHASRISKGGNKLFDRFANLPRKMSSNLESKQSGKTVLIPVDGSENSKRAFQCEYFHLLCY